VKSILVVPVKLDVFSSIVRETGYGTSTRRT
jgi:hypothetical protein